ncbi:MAG: hypothetical protein IJ682_04735 [Lachnospiraceae bacterium]|nr:hypothetical protein [Lachnospiraceae bacterium]
METRRTERGFRPSPFPQAARRRGFRNRGSARGQPCAVPFPGEAGVWGRAPAYHRPEAGKDRTPLRMLIRRTGTFPFFPFPVSGLCPERKGARQSSDRGINCARRLPAGMGEGGSARILCRESA